MNNEKPIGYMPPEPIPNIGFTHEELEEMLWIMAYFRSYFQQSPKLKWMRRIARHFWEILSIYLDNIGRIRRG